jgi:hypothetical protein
MKSLLGPSENMKKYGVIWSAETLLSRGGGRPAEQAGNPCQGSADLGRNPSRDGQERMDEGAQDDGA